jgi:hypothetical protein
LSAESKYSDRVCGVGHFRDFLAFILGNDRLRSRSGSEGKLFASDPEKNLKI